MNLAVIGSGGREHAICYKLKQSSKIRKLICIPGNAGTQKIAENIQADISNFKDIYQIIKKREKSISTIPSTLDEEIKFNPFMKYDNEEYLKIIGIENVSDEENFKKIRLLKDRF